MPWLKRFASAGKLVDCTDYCRRRALVDDFYAQAQAIGAVPYAARRTLDKLHDQPGAPAGLRRETVGVSAACSTRMAPATLLREVPEHVGAPDMVA